jgi:hypothetical protein
MLKDHIVGSFKEDKEARDNIWLQNSDIYKPHNNTILLFYEFSLPEN